MIFERRNHLHPNSDISHERLIKLRGVAKLGKPGESNIRDFLKPLSGKGADANSVISGMIGGKSQNLIKKKINPLGVKMRNLIKLKLHPETGGKMEKESMNKKMNINKFAENIVNLRQDLPNVRSAKTNKFYNSLIRLIRRMTRKQAPYSYNYGWTVANINYPEHYSYQERPPITPFGNMQEEVKKIVDMKMKVDKKEEPRVTIPTPQKVEEPKRIEEPNRRLFSYKMPLSAIDRFEDE